MMTENYLGHTLLQTLNSEQGTNGQHKQGSIPEEATAEWISQLALHALGKCPSNRRDGANRAGACN